MLITISIATGSKVSVHPFISWSYNEQTCYLSKNLFNWVFVWEFYCKLYLLSLKLCEVFRYSKTECYVINYFMIKLYTTDIDRLPVSGTYGVTTLLITNLGLTYKWVQYTKHIYTPTKILWTISNLGQDSSCYIHACTTCIYLHT